jgi:hypothetical protein
VVTAPAHREFSQEEGTLLAFFDVLLGLRAGPPQVPAAMGREVFENVLPMAAERAKVAALRFLAQSGLEERRVLRDGRLASGRLWDRHLNEGFELRFGPGFFDLAWMLARRSSSLQERKNTKKIAVASSHRTGDLILYTLAFAAVPGLGLLPDNAEVVARALAHSNPFTGLHALDMAGEAPCATLVADHARLLELADASLEEAWTSQIERVFPPRSPERFQRVRLALAAYVAALESAHRLDLVGPVLGALRRTMAPLEGVDVRALLLRGVPFSSMSARDEHFRMVAALFDIGRNLARRHRQLAGARYGDDHYDEARAFVAVFERSFAGVAAENERIHRELVPVVGG